jgi:hypothetical protein
MYQEKSGNPVPDTEKLGVVQKAQHDYEYEAMTFRANYNFFRMA